MTENDESDFDDFTAFIYNKLLLMPEFESCIKNWIEHYYEFEKHQYNKKISADLRNAISKCIESNFKSFLDKD